MNKHEYSKKTRLSNDMKKRFDDNTEFAKEFDDQKKMHNSYLDNELYEVESSDNRKN